MFQKEISCDFYDVNYNLWFILPYQNMSNAFIQVIVAADAGRMINPHWFSTFQ
jgi:hypothetical protein